MSEDRSCRDLTKYQHDISSVEDAFSRLVSGGKTGYRTIIEKKKEILKCLNCGKILEGIEKFCPECGTKVVPQHKN